MNMKFFLPFTLLFFTSRILSDAAVTPALVQSFTNLSAAMHVAFSPDGQTLALAGGNNAVEISDWRRGKVLRELPSSEHAVAVAVAPDGEVVAVRTRDGVRLFSASTGALIRFIENGTEGIPCVAFSRDGHWIASGDSKRTARVWEVGAGKLANTFTGTTNHLVFGVAFSPDGRSLVTGAGDGIGSAGDVTLWELPEGKKRWLHADKQIWAVTVTPDGSNVVAQTLWGKIKLLDARTGRVVREFDAGTDSRGVALSADGRLLAATARNDIRVWDFISGEVRNTLRGHANWVLSIAFSPDGKYLASGSSDNTVRVWKVGE